MDVKREVEDGIQKAARCEQVLYSHEGDQMKEGEVDETLWGVQGSVRRRTL